MTTYVALLRAINVTGKNPIKMDALRSLFSTLDFDDITTYVQSGNVVFTSTSRSASKVADTIARGIVREFGAEVQVLIRTGKELAKIADENPLRLKSADPSKLHVTFMERAPSTAKVKAIDPSTGAPDEFAVVGREVFLHCQNGYGRTKLNNTFFEKQLGVVATTRNLRTVQKLVDLASDQGAP
jgi:uncharacterized protein (DUF1697 family)